MMPSKFADKIKRCLKNLSWRAQGAPADADEQPWRHPFLTERNLKRFAEYSRGVLAFAQRHRQKNPGNLKAAFVVNMAQNMYKWATMAKESGWDVTVYTHPLDLSAISQPAWEEFDGEFENIYDGQGFKKLAGASLPLRVPCKEITMDGMGSCECALQFEDGIRLPLHRFLAQHRPLKIEPFISYDGIYPYFRWAEELHGYDVITAASDPIAAYLSQRPYFAVPVGGDMLYSCGRRDDYGKIMGLAFNAAHFLQVSNPHILAHCRRHGFTNGIYLRYPIDEDWYAPGAGHARARWDAEYGEGFYVLSSCRIDSQVKGNGLPLFNVLKEVVRVEPKIRFVFLEWGNDIVKIKEAIRQGEMKKNFIFLSPVGKKRLLDYYRSCDCVLDQFTLGYYGSTVLEAACLGKAVIMKVRNEHYRPLYGDQMPPILNAGDLDSVKSILLKLAGDRRWCEENGRAMRKWVVATHGKSQVMPALLGLLQLIADRTPLPAELINPLCDELTDEEKRYHAQCHRLI
ncbi:MAG: glycosyltransferase [Candidatus Omnitrophica bacterium]|nr:glycosyltransferase [Candidatus Omnitrophota bacterium]MDD5670789.1 glycosyltransferase [Candidatus Omnitrophota bacterium]